MIFIKSNPPVGHWPVPESFWPDPSMQSLVNDMILCSFLVWCLKQNHSVVFDILISITIFKRSGFGSVLPGDLVT